MRFDSDDVTKPGHSSQSDNLKNIFGNILPSAFKTSELERKYDYLNDRLETQLRILVPLTILKKLKKKFSEISKKFQKNFSEIVSL